MKIEIRKHTATVEKEETIFISEDGREFNNKEECAKYESTAAFALLTKIKEFEISRDFATDWIECGDENEYRTLLPTTDSHIEALNRMWKLFGGANATEPRFNANHKGQLILMGIRFYDESVDWCWFYSMNDIIKEISKGSFELNFIPEN